MWLIELIGAIVELWCSWRLYVSLSIAVGIDVVLHHAFPDQAWVEYASVSAVIIGLGLGFWWQIRADRT